MAVTQQQRVLYGPDLVRYIIARSQQLGLDPDIPLALIPNEGGFYGKVGDSGSSYGPFQLHRGGRLPPNLNDAQARAFGNSPSGIDYALAGIKQSIVTQRHDPGVPHGPGIPYGLWDAVRYFENPADPNAEWQAAGHTYARIGRDRGSIQAMLAELGILGGAFGGAAVAGSEGGAAAAAAAGRATARGAASGASSLEGKTGVALALAAAALFLRTWAVRAVEITAGAVLVLVGLLIFARAASGSSAGAATRGGVRSAAGAVA